MGSVPRKRKKGKIRGEERERERERERESFGGPALRRRSREGGLDCIFAEICEEGKEREREKEHSFNRPLLVPCGHVGYYSTTCCSFTEISVSVYNTYV